MACAARQARTAVPKAKRPNDIFLAVMTVFALITSGVLALNWLFPFVADAPVQMISILEWVDTFSVPMTRG